MDIRAIAASTAAASSTTTDATSTATTQKADGAKKDFATLFAEAKAGLKKGESLTKVDGHEYARIDGGTRDDMCINLSGNERSGQAFDLITRNGRQFHVYGGSGADHKVVEVGRKAPATGTTTTAATGGTASDVSPDATQKTS
jgi:hypothetical protein